jgi:hypothetical protein
MVTEGSVCRQRARWRRLCALAVAIALGVGVLLILPEWLRLFSRPVRRWLTEVLLQSLRLGYLATLLLAAPASLFCGWQCCRSRKRGDHRPLVARVLLLSVTCLAGILALEPSAAAWLAWAHRFPALPPPQALGVPRPVGQAARLLGSSSSLPTLPEHLTNDPANTLRVVVIGESSAQGFPYCPWLSIGQIVAWQLERALPLRRVELEILAQGGANLEMMHHKLARLKCRPDVMIIYAGHNEFQSRFEWSRTLRPTEAPRELVDGLFARVNPYSPLCRMIQEAIHTNRLDAPPPLVPRQVIDWPMCSAGEYAQVLADFERRLEAIVAYCEQLGTLPVLFIPPANDGGFEPSRSALPGDVSRAERAILTRDFQAARTAERDPARAITLYRALVARAPSFAEAHFRLARLLEGNGAYDQAARHYELARDADAVPIRCPGPFQDAYRKVAARHDCILIDGPAVLRAISPHGILNDTLFHDAHHPTLRAYVALAEALLHAFRARGAFGWPDGSEARLDAAECARHFGMDALRWWVVCERTSEFYRWLSITRFDPRERLEKAQRYAAAARQVAAGVAPELTGVPGLGPVPAR